MNRCLNDIMGYCQGDPKPLTKPIQVTSYDYRGAPFLTSIAYNGCKLSVPSCGTHLTQTELVSYLAK